MNRTIPFNSPLSRMLSDEETRAANRIGAALGELCFVVAHVVFHTLWLVFNFVTNTRPNQIIIWHILTRWMLINGVCLRLDSITEWVPCLQLYWRMVNSRKKKNYFSTLVSVCWKQPRSKGVIVSIKKTTALYWSCIAKSSVGRIGVYITIYYCYCFWLGLLRV